MSVVVSSHRRLQRFVHEEPGHPRRIGFRRQRFLLSRLQHCRRKDTTGSRAGGLPSVPVTRIVVHIVVDQHFREGDPRAFGAATASPAQRGTSPPTWEGEAPAEPCDSTACQMFGSAGASPSQSIPSPTTRPGEGACYYPQVQGFAPSATRNGPLKA